MIIARCYLRVSTEDQAKEGYSLGAQRDRLAAFATSQGWQVAEFYVDEGISAKDMNRPALQRLLKEVSKGEVVLVYKLDRLTRSVGDLDHLLRRWEGEGVLFRSCTEDFNTTTAAGRLFIRLVADLAQWERENLAERTRMGMVKRAQEGEWNGGATPFGYKAMETGERVGQKARKALVPDENAPVIREIYERYVAGQGMRQITLWLNREKGLKSTRGGQFTDATVSGILKNPVYCGLAAWNWGGKNGPRNPEAVVAEGKHPAIVSRELWEQAQKVREGRQSLPPRHATGGNILTGIGRCGACGAFLKMNRQSGDKERRYYRCGNYATKGTCRVSGLSADQVEANFVDAVCALADELTNPEQARVLVAGYLKEAGFGTQLAPEEIRRQMAQARQAIRVWDSALEQGEIDFTVWREKIEPHQIRLKDLESQANQAQTLSRASLAVETLAENLRDFRQIWAEATPNERKTLAMSFFRQVKVYPDKRVEVIPRVLFATG